MGALTSKPHAFSSRPWELQTFDFFDHFDIEGSLVNVSCSSSTRSFVISPRPDVFPYHSEFISDLTRFSYDSFLYLASYPEFSNLPLSISAMAYKSIFQPSWFYDFFYPRCPGFLFDSPHQVSINHSYFSKFFIELFGFPAVFSITNIRFFNPEFLPRLRMEATNSSKPTVFFDFSIRFVIPELATFFRKFNSRTIINFGYTISNLFEESFVPPTPVNYSIFISGRSQFYREIDFAETIFVSSQRFSYFFFDYFPLSSLKYYVFPTSRYESSNFETSFFPLFSSNASNFIFFGSYTSTCKNYFLYLPIPHTYSLPSSYFYKKTLISYPKAISFTDVYNLYPFFSSHFNFSYPFIGFTPSFAIFRYSFLVPKKFFGTDSNFFNFSTYFNFDSNSRNSTNLSLSITRQNEVRSNYIYFS